MSIDSHAVSIANKESINILIIDDDKSFCKTLKNFIQTTSKYKYDIEIAHNGEEALKILKTKNIDVIMVDIFMPIMDGKSFLIELHNAKIFLPIIIITAKDIKNIANKGNKGIVYYFQKPHLEKLNDVLEEIIVLNKDKEDFLVNSIAIILQVLQIENKTGVLLIKCENKEIIKYI